MGEAVVFAAPCWPPGTEPGPALVSVVRQFAVRVTFRLGRPVPPAPRVRVETLERRGRCSSRYRYWSTAKNPPSIVSGTGITETGPAAAGVLGETVMKSTPDRSAVLLS